MELRDGEDYLIDQYAILGVPRNADGETIKKAYYDLLQQHHPDKCAGLASEFRKQSEAKTDFMIKAYKILSDPEKRKVYDEKLNSWKDMATISSDGRAIVRLGGSGKFSSFKFLLGSEEDVLKENKELLDRLAPFNEITFKVLENLFNSTLNPSQDMRKAYLEVLEQKQSRHNLEEWLLMSFLGSGQKVLDNLTIEHKKEMENIMEESRKEIKMAVDDTILKISGGEVKLLEGTPETQELFKSLVEKKDVAVASYRKVAEEKFNEIANEIRKVAEKRETVAKKILDVLKADYYPENPEVFHPRLIVGFKISGKDIAWVAYCVKVKDGSGSIIMDETIQNPELVSLGKESVELNVALDWNKRGFSIAVVALPDSMSSYEQIKEQRDNFFLKHFSKVADELLE